MDGDSGRGQCVQQIMLTGNAKFHPAIEISVMHNITAEEAVLQLRVDGADIAAFGETEGQNLAVQAFHGTTAVVVVTVDDHNAVFGGQLSKAAERCDNIVGVLEEIQMVTINVENHRYRGTEGEERVLVFTGFGNKQITFANPQRAADGRQVAAYHNRRIQLSRLGKGSDHCSGGSFAVGAGNADHLGIMRHNEAPCFGTGNHRDACGAGGSDFGIVIVDRSGANDQSGIPYIVRAVTDGNGNTLLIQLKGIDRTVTVAAANVSAHIFQHFCQSTHGNAADTDQMDRRIGAEDFVKIQIIHTKTFLKLKCLVLLSIVKTGFNISMAEDKITHMISI